MFHQLIILFNLMKHLIDDNVIDNYFDFFVGFNKYYDKTKQLYENYASLCQYLQELKIINDDYIDDLKYDYIFVDEAQDFTSEWATIVKKLLVDENNSRLGVFFDDVQVLREDSFGDGFGIDEAPYLLRENIRNTANIYNWVADKTNLGTDMIANPVEGPTPITEMVYERGQLILLLETLFRRYLDEEYLKNDSLVIITDNKEQLLHEFPDGVAKWKLVDGVPCNETEIGVYSIEEYKGLESNMVLYIHDTAATENMNYIAYTRAKYYLIELVRNF